MEQPIAINILQTAPEKKLLPDSDISVIREMFAEMNGKYLVSEPPAYYPFLKRTVDVTVSLIFIIVIFSWLLPIVALLIKLTSRGPVFFTQKRTGRKGVNFNCYKFRTMYVNDGADTVQAIAFDKRITPIGLFLRITHIDETPQFFNVLLGDMSLIGPRPHMLYHTEYYSSQLPYYNLRHEIRPGLTGMAQIKGYVGEIHAERDLRKRIQWDIYYIKNRSIWLDIKILFTTIGQVMLKTFNQLFNRDDV